MNAHQRGTVEPVKLHPKWGRTSAETAQPSHMGSRWAASEGDQQDTGCPSPACSSQISSLPARTRSPMPQSSWARRASAACALRRSGRRRRAQEAVIEVEVQMMGPGRRSGGTRSARCPGNLPNVSKMYCTCSATQALNSLSWTCALPTFAGVNIATVQQMAATN
jgi:hypothetical protein